MKRILLHDISTFHFEGILGDLPGDTTQFAATPPVHHCTGCFGCWISTPGRCVIKDRAQDFAPALMDADELIVISRLYLGGFSPDIKAFMDRIIPALLPFFEIKDGVMRHPMRSHQGLRLTYYFYKDATGAPDSALITNESDDRHLIELAEDHLPLDGLLMDLSRSGQDSSDSSDDSDSEDNRPLEATINEYAQNIVCEAALSDQEQAIMLRLAEANAKNFRTSKVNVTYVGDMFALKEVLL